MAWTIEARGRAQVVTMNTNKANAQNDQFFSDLHEALDRLDADSPGAPVVLTGTGQIFSGGLDLDCTFPVFASGDDRLIMEWWNRYRATNVRLFSAKRPIIAAVNGHAFAGGLITALCCDYRVGPDSDARFALNEVPIGIRMPSVYVEIIRHAVGNRATSVWTLFGRQYDCKQALADGYLDELVPRERVVERAIEVAHELSSDALEAFVVTKTALRAPTMQRIETLSVEIDSVPSALGRRSVAANTAALERLKAKRIERVG